MMNEKQFEAKQIIFVFTEKGEKVRFSNQNLVIEDVFGRVRHQSTCYRLFALVVVGHFTITSGLLQASRKFSFPIVLLTNTLRIYEIIGNQTEGNFLLRKKQYSFSSLDGAKFFIRNKLKNQRHALSLLRGKSSAQKEAIKTIDGYLESLENYQGDWTGLLGIEGSAARVYFKNFFDNVEWNGRKPRLKNDFVNSTLDIAYTILFAFMEMMLRLYGFDLYYGILHKQFYQRKSLVCDVMEPLRPLMDYTVRKAINLGQCKEEDFVLVNQQYKLKFEENKNYLEWIMQPLMERKNDIFLYVQSYYRNFMKEKPPSEWQEVVL